MSWISLNDEEHIAIAELNTLPDRAAAIVGGALLDRRIELNLLFFMRDVDLPGGERLLTRLFRPSGVLGSFSAKIDVGFAIHRYSAGARSDMAIINRIRNRFAHDLGVNSFESQSITDLCANLKHFEQYFFEYKPHDPTPELTNPRISARDLDIKLTQPRERFTLALRLYTLALALNSNPPGI